jgi:hypothetical protein
MILNQPVRRVCLCDVTPQALVILKRHLPKDVEATLEHECQDRDAYQIRLEGSGLPEWATVNSGQYYMRATLEIRIDRTLYLTPGSGIPLEQVPADLLAEEAKE